MISFQKVMVKSRQVLNPFPTGSLGDRGGEARKRALGDYKCDTGMSVENVTAVVNMRTIIE